MRIDIGNAEFKLTGKDLKKYNIQREILEFAKERILSELKENKECPKCAKLSPEGVVWDTINGIIYCLDHDI